MGMHKVDLAGVVQSYEQALQRVPITVALREVAVETTLGELGVSLDDVATIDRIVSPGPAVHWQPSDIEPVLRLNREMLHTVVMEQFTGVVKLPVSAGLEITAAGTLVSTPSSSGEGIDLVSFERDVLAWIAGARDQAAIELVVVSAAPTVTEGGIETARQYAATLLREGMQLIFEKEVVQVKPFTLRRLLTFPEVKDASSDNYVLGVSLDEAGLSDYIQTTISPTIDQDPRDARFEREGDRVAVFQIAQEGRHVEVDVTIEGLLLAMEQQALTAPLAVSVTKPVVQDVADVEALGVTEILATGVSDFVGSPNNRVHNIEVGVSRYHGLLIAPGDEFSFNEQLGPVTGKYGWKPELVIKNNVTTPEFGGGICQVSTTVFRAAIEAGLEISQRRNHSYAVSYYGKPGFDATIYPGYTDLRFINNTSGYILIQARIEGTKVIFDFWGTDDGRQVTVTGPVTYDLQPDGAVKATLTREVTRDGEVLIDETFYSRYKSPKLFPKVIAIDDPQSAKP